MCWTPPVLCTLPRDAIVHVRLSAEIVIKCDASLCWKNTSGDNRIHCRLFLLSTNRFSPKPSQTLALNLSLTRPHLTTEHVSTVSLSIWGELESRELGRVPAQSWSVASSLFKTASGHIPGCSRGLCWGKMLLQAPPEPMWLYRSWWRDGFSCSVMTSKGLKVIQQRMDTPRFPWTFSPYSSVFRQISERFWHKVASYEVYPDTLTLFFKRFYL